MKRKTSKFTISTFFIGVFTFTALLGIFKNIDFSNEANIYIHGQKNQIQDIYKPKWGSLIPHDISMYEDPIPPDPEPTPDPDEGEGSDTPSTSARKESQAEWAQIAFMTAALSGTYGYEGDNYAGNTDIIYDDSILFSDDQDWNQTDIVKFVSLDPESINEETTPEQQKFAKLYNYSAGIKFYTETIGNIAGPTDIYIYIKTLTDSEDSSQMDQVQKDMTTYQENHDYVPIKGFNDLKKIANDPINGVENRELIKKDFSIIINTKDYRMEITSFLYTYAYLWQDSNSTVYDYKLTEELVALRPSFVWQQDVESGSTETAINPNKFNTAVDGQLGDNPETIPTTNNAKWNNWENNPDNGYDGEEPGLKGDWVITYNDYTKLPGEDALVGYRGIQTQNNSALSVDNQFWNYKNEFTYENDITTINTDSQLLAASKTGDAMLYEQFNESDGSYLISGGEDSGSYTLAHSIITPYVFSTNYNEETGLANKWEYSLYGDIINDSNVVTQINDEEKESIETSIFSNYTPLIIGSTLAEELSNEKKYTLTALYIIYSIYNAESSAESTSNPLLNNAYKYWNDQGFYIELTGKYYEDYSNLIPKLIQKDYGKK